VAKHFNISVGCFDNGKPALPPIFETWGIQSPEYSSVLEGRQFDLIISRHALNNGKLRPSDSAYIIPRILPLLKVGRFAMVHMLYENFRATCGPIGFWFGDTITLTISRSKMTSMSCPSTPSAHRRLRFPLFSTKTVATVQRAFLRSSSVALRTDRGIRFTATAFYRELQRFSSRLRPGCRLKWRRHCSKHPAMFSVIASSMHAAILRF
jgi:hypothetical protein